MTKTIDDNYFFEELPEYEPESFLDDLPEPFSNDLDTKDEKININLETKSRILKYPSPPLKATQKKDNKEKILKKQKKEDTLLFLEQHEAININEEIIHNSLLGPHEKDMVLENLELTNFNVSYFQSELNFIPLLCIKPYQSRKIYEIIKNRNQSTYLDFEIDSVDNIETQTTRKEKHEFLKNIKKLKNKINKKAKKLSIYRRNYVKGNPFETLKNFQKDKLFIYYEETLVIEALENLLKRLLNIDIKYCFKSKQFEIKTNCHSFLIDFDISYSNDSGSAGGLAHYTKNNKHRRIELIKPYPYDGFVFKDIETIIHEIGHCIDGFAKFFPTRFQTFTDLNLLDNIPFEKNSEIVSVFFEYLLYDKQFLEDIGIKQKHMENLLLGSYYNIMLNAHFTGNIYRSLLRKNKRLQYNVNESNFAASYLNNHSIYETFRFHENYGNFRMMDWYFYGHYNALKKLKEHFPDIYSYFK